MTASRSLRDLRSLQSPALAGLSLLLTTLSIGFALAGVVPPATPGYVGVLLSSVAAGINAIAIARAHLVRTADALQRAGLCAAAVAGPFLIACAWSAGGWLPLVWSAVLLCTGTAAGIVWIAEDDDPSAVQTSAAPVVATTESRQAQTNASAPAEPALHTDNVGMSSDPNLTQRIIRRAVADGESIEAEWKLEFAAGQTQQSLHLPIAPPFAGAPQVDCEPLDGADVELSIGAVYPYGIRIDARRTGDATAPAVTSIGLMITSEPRRAA